MEEIIKSKKKTVIVTPARVALLLANIDHTAFDHYNEGWMDRKGQP